MPRGNRFSGLPLLPIVVRVVVGGRSVGFAVGDFVGFRVGLRVGFAVGYDSGVDASCPVPPPVFFATGEIVGTDGGAGNEYDVARASFKVAFIT